MEFNVTFKLRDSADRRGLGDRPVRPINSFLRSVNHDDGPGHFRENLRRKYNLCDAEVLLGPMVLTLLPEDDDARDRIGEDLTTGRLAEYFQDALSSDDRSLWEIDLNLVERPNTPPALGAPSRTQDRFQPVLSRVPDLEVPASRIQNQVAGSASLLLVDTWEAECLEASATSRGQNQVPAASSHPLVGNRETASIECLLGAIKRGDVSMVKTLLRECHVKLDEGSENNRNVFHYAADTGQTEIVEELLKYAQANGYDVPSLLGQKDCHDVEKLCNLVQGNDRGRRAWHYVHLKRRCTLLFTKSQNRGGAIDVSLMGTVLSSGWDENIDWNELNEVLSKTKAASAQSGQPDMSPLALAIYNGHEDIAKMLIEAGASTRVTDCFGQTLMHLVAIRGLVGVATILRQHGLSPTAVDDEGMTPLQVAEINQQRNMIDYLQPAWVEPLESAVNDFVEVLQGVSDSLTPGPSNMQAIQSSGGDPNRLRIDTLRRLQIDINILLRDIQGDGRPEEDESPSPTLTTK